MAATVNNAAVKAQILQKAQLVAQAFVYNVEAFLEMMAMYNAVPLNTSDVATDVNSFYDNAPTSQTSPPVPSDMINAYSQMTVAQFGAMLANLNTWVTVPNTMSSNSLAILLNQMRILAGKPLV